MALLGMMLVVGAPIAIELSSPKMGFTSGEEIIFSATVKNQTKVPIEIVPQNDSMHWGRKAPYCTLETKLPDGTWDPLIMKGVGRCGNANPIKVSDFITVASGKTGDLLMGMPWSKYEVNDRLKEPGIYRIRLRYDTTQKIQNWLGGPLMPQETEKLVAETQPHFDRTPKGLFFSNEITIRVTQAP